MGVSISCGGPILWLLHAGSCSFGYYVPLMFGNSQMQNEFLGYHPRNIKQQTKQIFDKGPAICVLIYIYI